MKFRQTIGRHDFSWPAVVTLAARVNCRHRLPHVCRSKSRKPLFSKGLDFSADKCLPLSARFPLARHHLADSSGRHPCLKDRCLSASAEGQIYFLSGVSERGGDCSISALATAIALRRANAGARTATRSIEADVIPQTDGPGASELKELDDR